MVNLPSYPLSPFCYLVVDKTLSLAVELQVLEKHLAPSLAVACVHQQVMSKLSTASSFGRPWLGGYVLQQSHSAGN